MFIWDACHLHCLRTAEDVTKKHKRIFPDDLVSRRRWNYEQTNDYETTLLLWQCEQVEARSPSENNWLSPLKYKQNPLTVITITTRADDNFPFFFCFLFWKKKLTNQNSARVSWKDWGYASEEGWRISRIRFQLSILSHRRAHTLTHTHRRFFSSISSFALFTASVIC